MLSSSAVQLAIRGPAPNTHNNIIGMKPPLTSSPIVKQTRSSCQDRKEEHMTGELKKVNI